MWPVPYVFDLRYNPEREKSLSGNSGVTVSQAGGPWAGHIQDLQKRKEPGSRQLITLGH